ncbi:uncharacterized protein SCDLUD_001344 [Saccharomycodes ludwigii]|uniref:uncharacterized protein n=1 Tax=Saccharomycodes ludwigii TaxID=36035 RepID=UPI001E854F20|nr:hypothetical protein SCDLUD_001344 [Saccharomycodes ludwigii]KAH3901581.1 hypothetical protein SCDLUD_001344 [Saccharomycodes ludwigii]
MYIYIYIDIDIDIKGKKKKSYKSKIAKQNWNYLLINFGVATTSSINVYVLSSLFFVARGKNTKLKKY